MKGLVSVEKYGFIVDNKKRKDWARSNKIFVRKSLIKSLLGAKNILPKGYNFKIFDGKRSIEDQRRIIKICEVDFKNRDIKNWKEMLVKFTGGYESLKMKLPKDTHRQGGAIDLTILNEKGKELDMGGEKFDKRDALNYYERKKSLTSKEKKIKLNRKLLKKVMTSYGFEPHLPEWTHWGYKK